MKVLVTGGSSGLGAAITRGLSQHGHQVAFTYFRSADKARALVAELPGASAHRCDFGDADSVAALVAAIPDLAPDALVNNALAGLEKRLFIKSSGAAHLEGFRNNVMPTIEVTRAAAAVMRARGQGRIVTILTDYLLGAPPTGLSAYVASKAYLASLSRSWATELVRYGITAHTVSPSFMRTDLTADTDERVIEQLQERHPLRRLVEPAEVAEAVAFLLVGSPQLNGCDIVLNGGATMA